MIEPLPDTPFWNAYQAPFSGVLTWSSLDALWRVLDAAPHNWFVYDLNRDPPQEPASEDLFRQALIASHDMYAPVRNRSYCGTVYADSLTAPSFIKAFDPYKMGASCGSSGSRIMPRYVFSKIQPDPQPVLLAKAETGFFARFAARKAGRG